MKTRTFRTSFSLAIGVAVAALFAALPRVAQAQSTDIAVLHGRVDNIDSTLVRMDERLDRMDKRLDRMDDKFTKKFERLDATIVEIKENAARTDERINALQTQNLFIIVPLLFLILTTLFALLTKGSLWGVARAPKASAASRPAPIPPVQPHPS